MKLAIIGVVVGGIVLTTLFNIFICYALKWRKDHKLIKRSRAENRGIAILEINGAIETFDATGVGSTNAVWPHPNAEQGTSQDTLERGYNRDDNGSSVAAVVASEMDISSVGADIISHYEGGSSQHDQKREDKNRATLPSQARNSESSEPADGNLLQDLQAQVGQLLSENARLTKLMNPPPAYRSESGSISSVSQS
ncbi:hypothetical protein VKT23_009359 [Stygiomarasmius scandens]|uniref:Uncharacterized protein n=1 Tax=Marasmiellus scandens TaxID=2682957 RepID=A0ABR1JFW0_9AGAR